LTRRLGATLSPKAQLAEEARLARYFESIEKHRSALELAIDESFGGELDILAWRNAFDSSDPADTLRTVAITGSYSAVINAAVEILKAASGARLVGLLPHRRPHAGQAIEAAQEDGGLTSDQAALLENSYVLEGRIEHASPDVDADEVREAVEQLLEGLPTLIKSLHVWLATYDVTFEA